MKSIKNFHEYDIYSNHRNQLECSITSIEKVFDWAKHKKEQKLYDLLNTVIVDLRESQDLFDEECKVYKNKIKLQIQNERNSKD